MEQPSRAVELIATSVELCHKLHTNFVRIFNVSTYIHFISLDNSFHYVILIVLWNHFVMQQLQHVFARLTSHTKFGNCNCCTLSRIFPILLFCETLFSKLESFCFQEITSKFHLSDAHLLHIEKRLLDEVNRGLNRYFITSI